MSQRKVEVIPVTGLPEFKRADNLINILISALRDQGESLEDNDVLVVTQKIISKIEDRAINLESIDISQILENESTQILRKRGETVIARTKHGFICANAGIDKSNIKKGYALLLPEDPDKSAYRIRKKIATEYGKEIAVIISDIKILNVVSDNPNNLNVTSLQLTFFCCNCLSISSLDIISDPFLRSQTRDSSIKPCSIPR